MENESLPQTATPLAMAKQGMMVAMNAIRDTRFDCRFTRDAPCPRPTLSAYCQSTNRPAADAAIIPSIGLSFPFDGSTSTPKFSSVVEPRRHRESFGPNITKHGRVSLRSGIVNDADPRSLRSRRPSASTNSLVYSGSTPIACKRSSGIKLCSAPVSTQNSSSKYLFGSAGFATRALTLNMPIFVSSILSSRKQFTGKRKGSQPTGRAQERKCITSPHHAPCAMRLKTRSK